MPVKRAHWVTRSCLQAWCNDRNLVQGDFLYLDSLSLNDHRQLAGQLRRTGLRWFMTYDADERITDDLYQRLRRIA